MHNEDLDNASKLVHSAMIHAIKVAEYTLPDGEQANPLVVATYTQAIIDVYLSSRGASGGS